MGVGLLLAESAMLSAFGAAIGLLLGGVLCYGLGWLYPQLRFLPPSWAVVAALAIALGAGLLFGLLPARRAAALNAVDSLARR